MRTHRWPLPADVAVLRSRIGHPANDQQAEKSACWPQTKQPSFIKWDGLQCMTPTFKTRFSRLRVKWSNRDKLSATTLIIQGFVIGQLGGHSAEAGVATMTNDVMVRASTESANPIVRIRFIAAIPLVWPPQGGSMTHVKQAYATKNGSLPQDTWYHAIGSAFPRAQCAYPCWYVWAAGGMIFVQMQDVSRQLPPQELA